MTWLLFALGGIRKFLQALWGLVERYPWQAALIASLCFSAWLWRGWDKADAEIAAMDAAQKEAARLWKAEKQRIETAYAAQAKEADSDYQQALHDAHDRTERFIAANRVRSQTCRAAQPATATEGQAAGLPEKPAAETELVTVTPDDVRACSGAYVYANAAYEYGQRLIREGLAE